LINKIKLNSTADRRAPTYSRALLKACRLNMESRCGQIKRTMLPTQECTFHWDPGCVDSQTL